MMENRHFMKMHGAGNDFVVFADHDCMVLSASACQQLADRRKGIGADQIILWREGTKAGCIEVDFYNADGSRARACGNGTRCIGWWYMQKHDLDRLEIIVDDCTLSAWNEDGHVWVDMGKASFTHADVGYQGVGDDSFHILDLQNFDLSGYALVAMPNPHLVLHLNGAPTDVMVRQEGYRLEHHPAFAHRANIGFVWQQQQAFHLRVWERGAQETLACGSGACAAFAVLRKNDARLQQISLHMPGGILRLKSTADDHIALGGPMAWVFSGIWHG